MFCKVKALLPKELLYLIAMITRRRGNVRVANVRQRLIVHRPFS